MLPFNLSWENVVFQLWSLWCCVFRVLLLRRGDCLTLFISGPRCFELIGCFFHCYFLGIVDSFAPDLNRQSRTPIYIPPIEDKAYHPAATTELDANSENIHS
ncbi:hypothetical protein VTI28DRAFT_2440 [Corynascus sepedonium]